jgi:hypothetical protein
MYALPAGVPFEVGRAVAVGKIKPEWVKQRYLKQAPPPPVAPTQPALSEREMILERVQQVEGSVPAIISAIPEQTAPDRLDVATKQSILDIYERLRRLEELGPPPVQKPRPVNVERPPDKSIEMVERTYNIQHTEETLHFTTRNGLGQIMFTLVNDLHGKPVSPSEIGKSMVEHGWNPPQSTLNMNLGKLVKQGDLVREDGKYRPPHKVHIQVETA